MQHLLHKPALVICVSSFRSSHSCNLLFFFCLPGNDLFGGGKISGYGVTSHTLWPLIVYMMDAYVSSYVDFLYQVEMKSFPSMFRNLMADRA